MQVQFLGAFAKLRKATVTYAMFVRVSVRPSVRLCGKIPLLLKEF
jgi:hypothetical protein